MAAFTRTPTIPYQRYYIVEDRGLWLKVAGPIPFDPTIGALVYYYPHGHIQHTCKNESLSHSISRDFRFLCKIKSVSFLVDKDFEEIFAKLVLEPLQKHEQPVWNQEEEEPAILYSKILTKSDLNNSLRLSVTTSGIDKVFPEHVGGNSEPLSMKDLRMSTWKFGHRHSIRSNCYYLSGDWKRYVNEKSLKEGDTIVFKKNNDGSLYLAFDRKNKIVARGYTRFCVEKNEEFNKDGYIVRETLKHAQQGRPFEVIFYPKWSDFLVSPKVVREPLTKCIEVEKVSRGKLVKVEEDTKTQVC